MKSKLAAALIAALALAGCNATTQSTRNFDANAEFSNGGATGMAQAASLGDALTLSSRARQQHGLAALGADRRLQKAAQDHANWMARHGVMQHTGAGGSRFSDRIRGQGYTLCYGAENIAFGQRSAAHVVHSWMTSPGHRKNMLDPRAQHAAVASAVDGVGQVYWAMVLAKPC